MGSRILVFRGEWVRPLWYDSVDFDAESGDSDADSAGSDADSTGSDADSAVSDARPGGMH